MYPNLLGREERGWTEASDKPQRPQQLCEDRALQDGGPPHSPRPSPGDGLDDETGSEGCIPSNPKKGAPIPPPIPMGTQDLPICVSPIWTDISSPGMHKNNETSCGDATADGNSSDYTPRQYLNYALIQGTAHTAHSCSVPNFPGPWPDGQHGDISACFPTGDGVPGIPSELSFSTFGLPSRKDEENTAGYLSPHTPAVSLDKRPGQICGKVSASTRAIWQVPLHYRAVQNMINSVTGEDQPLVNRVSRFNVKLQLTLEAERDLQWWISLDRSSLMVSPLLPCRPIMTIESDASNTGWRACQGETQTGGQWSKAEFLNHISHLELNAAFLAIQCFAKKSNIVIKLKLDNICNEIYIPSKNSL